MSTTVFKAGYYVPLLHLDQFSLLEARDWFVERLGVPKYEEIYDDESYLHREYSWFEVFPRKRERGWGITFLTSHERDYGTMFSADLRTIKKVSQWLGFLLDSDPDSVVVIAYEYWTGGDDPLWMKDPKPHSGRFGYDIHRFPDGLPQRNATD